MKKLITITAMAVALSTAIIAQSQEAPAKVPAEPKARPNMEQMVEKMFTEADANKDGVLSKEEFAASMKKRMEGRGQGGQGGMGGGRGQGGMGGGKMSPPMAE